MDASAEVSAMSCSPLCILLTEIGLHDRRILDHVSRRAIGNQAAIVEHHYPRADVENDFHQVFNHHDGDAVRGKLMNELGRPLNFGAVQASIDFVEKQKLWT